MKKAPLAKKKITIDHLAQMVAKGFGEMNDRFEAVNSRFNGVDVRLETMTNELVRLGADIRDLKNTAKSHQEMLIDHESRLMGLEA